MSTRYQGDGMAVDYKLDHPVSLDQFAALLYRSGLSARRPVDDRECLQGMLDNSNLSVSAWDGLELVGFARSMTDFHYACYLSDLAVAQSHQGQGIGRELMQLTRSRLGPRCKLVLVAAPDADSYYAELGFNRNSRCWVLQSDESICG